MNVLVRLLNYFFESVIFGLFFSGGLQIPSILSVLGSKLFIAVAGQKGATACLTQSLHVSFSSSS